MKTMRPTHSGAYGRIRRSAASSRDDDCGWRGDATGRRLETCSFCGEAKPRYRMVRTADGLYCRQCWLDHWL